MDTDPHGAAEPQPKRWKETKGQSLRSALPTPHRPKRILQCFAFFVAFVVNELQDPNHHEEREEYEETPQS